MESTLQKHDPYISPRWVDISSSYKDAASVSVRWLSFILTSWIQDFIFLTYIAIFLWTVQHLLRPLDLPISFVLKVRTLNNSNFSYFGIENLDLKYHLVTKKLLSNYFLDSTALINIFGMYVIYFKPLDTNNMKHKKHCVKKWHKGVKN